MTNRDIAVRLGKIMSESAESKGKMEALLFASVRPLSVKSLATILHRDPVNIKEVEVDRSHL